MRKRKIDDGVEWAEASVGGTGTRRIAILNEAEANLRVRWRTLDRKSATNVFAEFDSGDFGYGPSPPERIAKGEKRGGD